MTSASPVKGPKSWVAKILKNNLHDPANENRLPDFWDVRSLDEEGFSLLDVACQMEAFKLVDQIMERGGSFTRWNQTFARGSTPLHVAAEWNSARLAKELAAITPAHVMAQETGTQNLSPLLFAVMINAWEVAEAFVDAGADPTRISPAMGLSILGQVILSGNEKGILLCVEKGWHAPNELDDITLLFDKLKQVGPLFGNKQDRSLVKDREMSLIALIEAKHLGELIGEGLKLKAKARL